MQSRSQADSAGFTVATRQSLFLAGACFSVFQDSHSCAKPRPKMCGGVPREAGHTVSHRGQKAEHSCVRHWQCTQNARENNQSLGSSRIAHHSLSSLCPESEGPSADEALGAGIVCRCRVRRRVESAGKCPERLTEHKWPRWAGKPCRQKTRSPGRWLCAK